MSCTTPAIRARPAALLGAWSRSLLPIQTSSSDWSPSLVVAQCPSDGPWSVFPCSSLPRALVPVACPHPSPLSHSAPPQRALGHYYSHVLCRGCVGCSPCRSAGHRRGFGSEEPATAVAKQLCTHAEALPRRWCVRPGESSPPPTPAPTLLPSSIHRMHITPAPLRAACCGERPRTFRTGPRCTTGRAVRRSPVWGAARRY